MRPRNTRVACLLAVLLTVSLLSACAQPAPITLAPPDELTPGPATLAAPEASAAPAATEPPSPTLMPTEAMAPAAPLPTPVPGRLALLSLREGSVFVGDSWGGGSKELLSLGEVSSVALHGTQLAFVAGGGIFVADLVAGSVPQRLADAPPAFLLGPDLVWTANGQALLTIADREDTGAQQTGLSIDIGIVAVPGGGWRPGLALADRAGASVLRAESVSGQVLLVAWGSEPSFQQVLRYDLTTGQAVGSLPIAGQGEIIPSPDGKLALTSLYNEAKGANEDLLYDLTDAAATVRQRLPLRADTHTAGRLWSPEGDRIAYLLREGRTPGDEQTRGLGLYLWDLKQARATKVADVTDPAGGPVAWTPDGRYLVFRQTDAAGANAFYALDTTDNTLRRLPLDPASRILGWLPQAQ
ncbi:MAG: TolB family protein [Anaerolineae bacterium]